MSNSKKLNFDILLDWLEGRLPEGEAKAIEQQVAMADETTQADVAWIRTFLQVSQETTLASPPATVRTELTRRFEAYAQKRPQPGLLQQLVAILTFDSHSQSAAAGIRAASTPETQRQLIYTTDVADIALNVQPRSNKLFDLNGQVLPTEEVALDNFSVQLLRDMEEKGLTTTDNLGEFLFEAIPTGIYELIVSNDQFEALIALAV